MSSILTLQNITRTYTQGENSITPLSNFSLEIKAGELVALVGPSGSGKTTLLQIAGLLDNPTSGDISIGGEAMSKANDALRTATRKNQIGFVYQFHHLLPEFSALENVILPQMIAGISHAQAQNKALQLLTELGLENRVHHRPAKLSGGECQRVAIARALANDPALLLADEPTGNLDHATSGKVFALLTDLARHKNIAMLLATHNMELASQMDRIIKL